jgi:hypothetical protein
VLSSRKFHILTGASLLCLLGCTQLRPVTNTGVGITGSPVPSPSPFPSFVPFPSPSPTPTPPPTPTPVPSPQIVLSAPTASQDFTATGVPITYTVTPAVGRSIAGTSVSYDGSVLQTSSGSGPQYVINGWDPNQADSVASPANAMPMPKGPHTLTITATDNLGGTSTLSFPFSKEPKIVNWAQLPDMPGPVSHAQAFSDGAQPPSFVTVWGSQDGNGQNVTARPGAFSFNPAGQGAWSTLSLNGQATPSAEYGAAVDPSTGWVYLMGGRQGTQDLNAFSIFTPLSNQISTLGALLNTARHDLAGAVVNGALYAIGGSVGNVPSYAVERIQLGSAGGTWQVMSNLLNARTGATAAPMNGQIWVFGGGFRPVEVYNPTSNQWSYLKNTAGQTIATPFAWYNSLMLTINNNLFFFGGTTQDGQPVTHAYLFDTTALSWTDEGPLPQIPGVSPQNIPTTRLQGFATNGHVYLVGGISVPVGQVSAHVFMGNLL